MFAKDKDDPLCDLDGQLQVTIEGVNDNTPEIGYQNEWDTTEIRVSIFH